MTIEIIDESELPHYSSGYGRLSRMGSSTPLRGLVGTRREDKTYLPPKKVVGPKPATWDPFSDDTGSVGKQCPELSKLLTELKGSGDK